MYQLLFGLLEKLSLNNIIRIYIYISFKIQSQQFSVLISKQHCVLLGPSSVLELHYSLLDAAAVGKELNLSTNTCEAGSQIKISLNLLNLQPADQDRKIFIAQKLRTIHIFWGTCASVAAVSLQKTWG